MQTLRAIEIYSRPAVRVIVIESVVCNQEMSRGFCRLYARIQPAAVIVCESDDHHMVSLESAETSLEEFKSTVPGLRSLLGETR